MYPSEIITQTLALIQEASTSEYASASRSMMALNAVYRTTLNRVIDECRDAFLTSASLSVVADTASYTLPPNCVRVRGVQDAASVESFPFQRYEEDDTWTDGWYIKNGSLILGPTPTKTETWTLWYDRRPPLMTYGTVAAVADTTITLAATATGGVTSRLNDYYNGATIAISSGTDAGDSRTVLDYVGSTRVLTVDDWTVNPNTASVYEVLPELPEDYHQALAWGAAALLLRVDGSEAWPRMHQEWIEQVRDLLMVMGRQQGRMAPIVQDTGR